MFVVTGATGNTGSVVAKSLLSAGKQVRGIGRNTERLRFLELEGGEPVAADLTDPDALAKAFEGAEGVYVMIPPDISTHDPFGYQESIFESIATALERAKVRDAVALSSIGADKPEKTGPVVGLHRMEQRLNRIPDLNVLHLRPGYFMENTLAQIAIIPTAGSTLGPLLPDLKLPMIDTVDIGNAAADALLKQDFRPHETRELLGQRDISMNEVTSIIGKGIEMPDLKYFQAQDKDIRAALVGIGMSQEMTALILEMTAALNSGYMKALETRSPHNTTRSSYETFFQQNFLPRYKGTYTTQPKVIGVPIEPQQAA
jgi:uncharacterized protein YbjT (DUF2867 family)